MPSPSSPDGDDRDTFTSEAAEHSIQLELGFLNLSEAVLSRRMRNEEDVDFNGLGILEGTCVVEEVGL